MNSRSTAAIALSALAVTASGMGLTAAESHAASSCSGRLVGSYELYAGGEAPDGYVHGQMDIYYSTADGGTNCLVTRANNAGEGRKYMKAEIGPTDSAQTDVDENYYYSYAGPVVVTGTAGRCVTAYGEVIATDGTSYRRALNGVHCG